MRRNRAWLVEICSHELGLTLFKCPKGQKDLRMFFPVSNFTKNKEFYKFYKFTSFEELYGQIRLSSLQLLLWKDIWLQGVCFCKNWAELTSFKKAMTPHSSTLAWQIPWMEEPGRLQSMGSLGVEHRWATSLSLFTFMHWRRKWQPTPVFLPGESQGRGNLVGCRLWGRTESDTTEVT